MVNVNNIPNLTRANCDLQFLLSCVEVVDVGSVVLAVVQFHYISADVRLQGVIGVGQVWQCVFGSYEGVQLSLKKCCS